MCDAMPICLFVCLPVCPSVRPSKSKDESESESESLLQLDAKLCNYSLKDQPTEMT